METKVCKFCGQEKSVEEFYKNGWGVTDCCKECHAKRMAEGKAKRKKLQQQAVDALNARNLRLSDFSPRELMEELHRRGYEGKLRYVKIEEIDITNF